MATDDARLHRMLSSWNRDRLGPSLPAAGWREALREEVARKLAEGEFVERERAAVAPLAALAPRDPDGFVAWFERLRETGPGQGDPLFPWLAARATAAELRWFLVQEVAGEAGFDDLVALSQVKVPVRAKLELARNYWDEMGRGRAEGMHGKMLADLAREVGAAGGDEPVVWESLALGNLLVALATTRRYGYHALGALGAIELTAPTRAVHVVAGLRRVGVSKDGYRYFALHATLDLRHSAAWNREVLATLVAARPEVAPLLAEGALMRLRAGERCFDRYRRELERSSSQPRRARRAASSRSNRAPTSVR
ncbi:MAG TPA: iron-containing redox enzyme family protein [Anaeromyxobacteraceae bacterium]|nr:iron-containing redox enzyme family protein [Anaeromyxobacteraceae bacterium]